MVLDEASCISLFVFFPSISLTMHRGIRGGIAGIKLQEAKSVGDTQRPLGY